MKNYLSIALLALTSMTFGAVHVNGYTNNNGTYVAPHYRSDPNGTKCDNWSTKGNVNPYTGKSGTISHNECFGCDQTNVSSYSQSTYENQYSTTDMFQTMFDEADAKYDKHVYSRGNKIALGQISVFNNAPFDYVEAKEITIRFFDSIYYAIGHNHNYTDAHIARIILSQKTFIEESLQSRGVLDKETFKFKVSTYNEFENFTIKMVNDIYILGKNGVETNYRMGTFYGSLGDYEKATYYCAKAIQIESEHGNPSWVSDMLHGDFLYYYKLLKKETNP